ncbi:MAG TPA: Holliday junction resolvase RuvX [Candidatus Dormibacteraeota bacterium]|jgi:putative holliday junction resolvase|nr:Holliday junction resolvase RuvX [Candidatus Dormibacteraeota bacterium]
MDKLTKVESQVAAPVRETAKRTRILALDYGRSRIGMALADEEARLARPLGTLERINRNEDMRRLRELTNEHSVREIVVGLPLHMDGSRGEMAEEAARFAERIRKQIGLPVKLLDERLSSWEAERILEEEMGKKFVPRNSEHPTRRKREDSRISVDAVAAMVILREYLEGALPSKELP